MDAPCFFNTFTPAAAGIISFQTHQPMSICPPPALPPCGASKGFFPLVAVPMEGRRGDMNADGTGALSATQLAFRNIAALLYRSVPRMPKAGPAGSSSGFPPPDDPDEESDAAGAEGEEEEEGGVSEEMAEELACLEEEAMAGSPEGREPGDYDRRAHLFDESARVFQALKEQEDANHRRREGS